MSEPNPAIRARLDALKRDFEELARLQVGYPCNQDFDYSALTPFLEYTLNNVGDPFHDSISEATPTRWSARSSPGSPP